MSPRKKMTTTPTTAEEAAISNTTTEPTAEDIGLTAEMTDAEAIETLVRTDEEHLTEDAPTGRDAETGAWTDEPKQVHVKPGVTEGTKSQKTQGSLPEKFHCLSEIDDGVFVAWDRCHNGTARHSISDCKCKGGPTEPPYVTKWREEWIEKRTKATLKVIEKAKKDTRQKPADETLAATVSDGIETATEAVAAASEEDK